MNIDFSTLCMISVPGFLIGFMTGRVISGRWFRQFKDRLGILGQLLSIVFFVPYLVAAVITLGIMIIYLANLPDTAKPVNFWVTTFLALWIVLNLLFDFTRIFRRSETKASH